MGPAALAQVLRPLHGMFDPERHPDLLVGLDLPDDALVWRIDAERALVQTADFFPPVVDDPYAFGSIAAANALSDVYAMGAEPLFAMNLVGFPEDLDLNVLSEILRGGAEKVREAGAVVAGGHTTADKEPKYGLAVTGWVHPDRILSKGGARPGDVLLLTKPLGSGIVTTAHKKGKDAPEDLRAAVSSMARLSAVAARAFREAWPDVHALTDVTGFGLVGHAHEMAHASMCGLRVRFEALPLLSGTEGYARAGFLTGGAGRNQEFYGAWTIEESPRELWQRQVLWDPQTSGGLLAAVDPEAVPRLLDAFEEVQEPVWTVGEVVAGRPGEILIA